MSLTTYMKIKLIGGGSPFVKIYLCMCAKTSCVQCVCVQHGYVCKVSVRFFYFQCVQYFHVCNVHVRNNDMCAICMCAIMLCVQCVCVQQCHVRNRSFVFYVCNNACRQSLCRQSGMSVIEAVGKMLCANEAVGNRDCRQTGPPREIIL